MLHYETTGYTYNPIAFLHGIGGTSRYWKARVAPLETQHQLIFVDLLGFGKSPKPWTQYTVDRHVEELNRVLQKYESLTLVGHSFGAITALAFAARHPELVRNLVLISLPCFRNKESAVHYYSNLPPPDRYIMTNIAFAAVACVMTRRVLRGVLPYIIRDKPREIVQDLTQHTWRSYTSSVWDGMYHHDLFADAEHLNPDCSKLFLHGEHDRTAPLSGIQQLVANHPDWELRVLPGCDHHPLIRNPEWCLEGIRSVIGEQYADA
ncbi:MAG TPA: alpha/beta hydrolase [Chromatiales bacterium]|nr:alpha/beta hydrolase [Thiotrichales bacterium]HIP69032.1 alpha/beta hydrolase [Chromatiales bacterium]